MWDAPDPPHKCPCAPVGEEMRWQQKQVAELCEEPGGRCFLAATGWFQAGSQLSALLLHTEQEMHPLNSTCYSQRPGCWYLAAAFEHIMQQKSSVRCKRTACYFFSSGPHLLDMDMQIPASYLSCPWWQEQTCCPSQLASRQRPHAYAEYRAAQLFLNSACIPRGAVPSHALLENL